MVRKHSATAPPRGVQTVERAFELLEAIGSGDRLRMSELASVAGLPASTVHRLIQSMAAKGYLQLDGDRRWSLGPRAAWLGARATHQRTAWVRPFLEELVAETGETASLATLQADRVVYVAVVPSAHSMRTEHTVGAQVLPHCTAVGKALLSQLTETGVRRLVARVGLPRYTDRTVVDVDELIGELAVIRQTGWAVDDGEQEVGVQCVAAVITDASTPSALSVSGPASRIAGHPSNRLTDAVQRVAAAASTYEAAQSRNPDMDDRAQY